MSTMWSIKNCLKIKDYIVNALVLGHFKEKHCIDRTFHRKTFKESHVIDRTFQRQDIFLDKAFHIARGHFIKEISFQAIFWNKGHWTGYFIYYSKEI